MNYPFQHFLIEDIYNTYPTNIQKKCLQLRTLIFDIASNHSEIGPIEETLRWNEPTYIPSQSKSGSMIRIHHKQNKPYDFALYFLCNTSLIDQFKEQYPNSFTFGGNRALEFMVNDPLPLKEIKNCMYQALTYYLD